MAHGYPRGGKYRGGAGKQSVRSRPKPSKRVSSRKVHDTARNKR